VITVGELGGFLRIRQVGMPMRDPRERTADYREFLETLPAPRLREQAARCMDCGVPFCHEGCPLGNLIPDWNDLVHRDQWRNALEQLHATNDFPEFTGRLCPAPCEHACVLAINDDPVTIKQIEKAIIDRGFEEGWVVARPPTVRTGRTVAVVGSGPAGLAAASRLNRAGHTVTVFERDELPGGLMRFGTPDFKIEKWVIDRRVRLLEEEGVELRCGVDVGRDTPGDELTRRFDAVVLAIGARVPRELPLPGRDLDGIHLAMDYLYQRNRAIAAGQGRRVLPLPEPRITAAGKRVVVIGGGDTGMDCIANAHRERAASVTQLDTYDGPSQVRWPYAPKRLPTTYALCEGGDRRFGMLARRYDGAHGRVTAVEGVRVAFPGLVPVSGSEFVLPADLVLIAVGFIGPEPDGLLAQLGIRLDGRPTIKTRVYATAVPGVFAAGDAHRGSSLVVWAIAEGRQCARVVDRHLMGPDPFAPARPPQPPRGRRVASASRRRRRRRRGDAPRETPAPTTPTG
jgi:glutamate synthase (NADPH/NADH) small chain